MISSGVIVVLFSFLIISFTEGTIKLFLLSGGLVYRLYYVQINQSDVYTALAASQHEISSKLIPDRGKIIINDSAGSESTEYTLATNKDFYLISANYLVICHILSGCLY